MGKKYLTKKLKKRLQEEAELNPSFNGLNSPAKDKKIAKEPRTKDTILSDIELQIVDMFSRSFTNGEIGIKYPQQKKKGMMRLMNFCFRTIIEEVELYVSSSLKKEAQTAKCIDKRERTIFYLSSNYRYKHIEKCNYLVKLALLEDFKFVCKNFVKYRCLEHLDMKFLEKFYKKVIFNDFNGGGTDFYKSTKETKVEPIAQPEEPEQSEPAQEESPFQKKTLNLRSPKTIPFKQVIETTTVAKPKTVSKRGRKKKNPQQEIQYVQQTLANQDQNGQIDLGTLESLEPKTNKICIEKINIYLGYDSKSHLRQSDSPTARLLAHPYARMEVEQNETKQTKRKWTVDMQSELIDQFMNSSATSPNMIIRNLMKKFGRNKLFVESEINTKRKEMFKTSVAKFIEAFEGKTLCSEETVRKMEITLKSMNLSPKNYFIAGFIHDFYFKQVQGISVTLLSEYVHKLSREQSTNERFIRRQEQDDDEEEISITEKKKILERQDLKYALNTMSKIVANYNYD